MIKSSLILVKGLLISFLPSFIGDEETMKNWRPERQVCHALSKISSRHDEPTRVGCGGYRKPYPERLRLSKGYRQLGLPQGVDPKHFQLIAPYESNPNFA